MGPTQNQNGNIVNRHAHPYAQEAKQESQSAANSATWSETVRWVRVFLVPVFVLKQREASQDALHPSSKTTALLSLPYRIYERGPSFPRGAANAFGPVP